VLGAWLLLVIILAATGNGGGAVALLVVPVFLLFVAAKVQTDNDRKISKVGVRGAAGLGCPKCGGAQFKAKRSGVGKVGLGLLAPKTRVRCVTCGTQFVRG
jgi:O-antigen ligase